MNYKIVAYTIRFKDRGIYKGIAPYSGEDISTDAIRDYIADCVFELEGGFEEISIDLVRRYDDEHGWIISVHQLAIFRLLYWKEHYCQDLLEKYKLPAPPAL